MTHSIPSSLSLIAVCLWLAACSPAPAQLGELPTLAVIDSNPQTTAMTTDQNEVAPTTTSQQATTQAVAPTDTPLTEAIVAEATADVTADATSTPTDMPDATDVVAASPGSELDIERTDPVTIVGEMPVIVRDRQGGSNFVATIPQAQGWSADEFTLTNGAVRVELSVIEGTDGEAPLNLLEAIYRGDSEIQSIFSLDYNTTLLYAYDATNGLLMVHNTSGASVFLPLIVAATGSTADVQAAFGAIVEMTKSVALMPQS